MENNEIKKDKKRNILKKVAIGVGAIAALAGVGAFGYARGMTTGMENLSVTLNAPDYNNPAVVEFLKTLTANKFCSEMGTVDEIEKVSAAIHSIKEELK